MFILVIRIWFCLILLEFCPIMLAICLLLYSSYYSNNFAGEIDRSLYATYGLNTRLGSCIASRGASYTILCLKCMACLKWLETFCNDPTCHSPIVGMCTSTNKLFIFSIVIVGCLPNYSLFILSESREYEANKLKNSSVIKTETRAKTHWKYK